MSAQGPDRDESKLVPVEMPEAKSAERGDNETPIFKKRRDLVEHPDYSFSPNTLMGSFVHRIDANEGVIWEGRVVGHLAEGQGENIYLLELQQSLEGQHRSKVQVLVPLTKMLFNDDGYEYRFYDDEETMRSAYAEFVTAEGRVSS